MKKLPIKQIYLLVIIIVGIFALSIYSTYAIFTYESSTSDIVSIHTPNSLNISEEIYEYKQVEIDKNSFITTDVDIYNSLSDNMCYSVWYKIVGANIDNDKVEIFEKTSDSLTTSGILDGISSKRITLVIINDNDIPIKVNVGISSSKYEETCSLNMTSDKININKTYNYVNLLNKIIQTSPSQQELTNYLTYKDITKEKSFNENDEIVLSKQFTYKDEVFTLTDSFKIKAQDLNKYVSSDTYSYYMCQDDCHILYKIIDVKSEEKIHKIIKYDKYIGYFGGESGVKSIITNSNPNYVYYGDNPNNFMYFNCSDNTDTKTCELWRIVGTYYNKDTKEYNTKIVKNDSIGQYQYDSKINQEEIDISSNTWIDLTNKNNNSKLASYLDKEYKLINHYDNYIVEYPYNIEKIDNLDVLPSNLSIKLQSIKSKISLINVSDYLNKTICQDKKLNDYETKCIQTNWLNNIEINDEWTLTTKDDEEQKTVYTIGSAIKETNVTEKLDVRPVVYLKSRIFVTTGNGTLTNPYIIK